MILSVFVFLFLLFFCFISSSTWKRTTVLRLFILSPRPCIFYSFSHCPSRVSREQKEGWMQVTLSTLTNHLQRNQQSGCRHAPAFMFCTFIYIGVLFSFSFIVLQPLYGNCPVARQRLVLRQYSREALSNSTLSDLLVIWHGRKQIQKTKTGRKDNQRHAVYRNLTLPDVTRLVASCALCCCVSPFIFQFCTFCTSTLVFVYIFV